MTKEPPARTEAELDPQLSTISRLVRRLSFGFATAVSAAFIAFNLLVLYAPDWLSQPVASQGLLSRGMALGLALIVLGVAATGLFVRIVNSRFDRLLAEAARRLSEEARP